MVISLLDWLAGQRGFSGGAASAGSNDLLQAETAGQTDPAEQRTYLVFLKEPTEPGAVGDAVELLLQQVAPGSSPRQIFSQLAGFAVDLNEDQAGRLRLRREVGSLELDQAMRLDPPMRPDGADNDVFLPQVLVSYTNAIGASRETVPWGVRAIWQGRDISSAGNAGAGTYAFVIDSGVLATTGDLNLNTAWSRSWIAGQDAFTDGAGHGTHVAGTIGAQVNGRGVVGVAPGASIVSLKVFDSTGSGSSANIIAAIDHAVSVITSNNLDLAKVVINLSLGGGLSAALNTAMLNAANAGIRLVVAAGNGNAFGIGVDADTVSPATTGTHPNIYTVSAVDSSYRMATWSNWDLVTTSDPIDSVDLAAPGVAVTSYYKNGTLTNVSGTSMAAPHVAGALLMGGVQAGDLVTPSRAGTADPFAWATTFPGGTPGVTYSLSAPAAAVDEGLAASLAIATTGLATGTSLYWRLGGTGITTADFLGLNTLSGSSLVGADGSAAIDLTINPDLLTEGNELLSVQLYADSALTQLVASRTLTLNDASRAPVTNQTFWGTTASDTIIGGTGNDQLAGVTAAGLTARNLGQRQIDVLTGGIGTDTFVLGDARGVFYDDRRNGNLGTADYARITDFQTGIDKLQLRNASYFTTVTNGVTSIYWDRNANNRFDTTGNNRDELIAMVAGSIANTDIIWA
jgi:subtilisin family serine protease